MRETSILIKPASAECNCVCTYCFYDDVSNCRVVKSHGLIKEETWKKLVDDAFSSKHQFERVNFMFQGGEPLLAGHRFFSAFIDYTQENRGAIEVSYAVQTNGTRITDRLCKLFKEYDFLVGISIDGFKENHNMMRFLHDVGSFDAVMAGLELLKKHNIEYNVLTVLTKQLAKQPEKLYNFYKEQGFKFVQLIPCLPNFGIGAEEDLYACTPELYGSFYTKFYELWLNDFKHGHYLSESLIDNVITMFMGGYPDRCGMLGFCQSQCVVEANGSVYPCDFYVLDEFESGNINTMKLDDILEQDVMETFKDHDQVLPEKCKTCPFQKICNGNCKRMRPTFINEDTCGYQLLLQDMIATYPEVVSVINSRR